MAVIENKKRVRKITYPPIIQIGGYAIKASKGRLCSKIATEYSE
ncbi:hypothetical protein [Natronincola peptidivorans]|nr:hypothetical protein [Natronincola peptidivorans]